jgi:hypothetical protein
MGSYEQFAGWGLYDHSAVCLTCGHQHLIPKAEQISEQPWLDWLAKHPGHETLILPHRLLSRLAGVPLHHNADAKIAYAASADYTCTLTGLASDTNLLAGRESSSLSNASNKYLDELVSGKITAGTSPTDARQIEVHCVGALDDTPNWPDVFDGTDSAETITSAGIKNAIVAPVAVIATNNTSDRVYPFRPLGVRQLFGDGLPPAHVLFVVHNTGVNLNATATNQKLTHTPVYATVA